MCLLTVSTVLILISVLRAVTLKTPSNRLKNRQNTFRMVYNPYLEVLTALRLLMRRGLRPSGIYTGVRIGRRHAIFVGERRDRV